MKWEYNSPAEAEADAEEFRALAREQVAAAVAKMPEDLRGFIGEWSREGINVGFAWWATILTPDSPAWLHSEKRFWAVEINWSARSEYGRTTMRVLKKTLRLNDERLYACLEGFARAEKARGESIAAKEANHKAWMAAGKPGGDVVTITAKPDTYKVRAVGLGTSPVTVPLDSIEPALAAMRDYAAKIEAIGGKA